MRTLKVETKQPREVIDITPLVEKLLEEHPARDGMMHLFLMHSTAALTTAYIEEGLDLNMIGAFEIMLPPHTLIKPGGNHSHHMSHLPAHITASMIGPHLAVPVEKNKVKLGKFQSLILVELNGPRDREIIIDYQEET